MPNCSDRSSVEVPDVWDWILAAPADGLSDYKIIKLCNGPQVPLLAWKRHISLQITTLSLFTDFASPKPLWRSEPHLVDERDPISDIPYRLPRSIQCSTAELILLTPEEKAMMYSFFLNFIDGILCYGEEYPAALNAASKEMTYFEALNARIQRYRSKEECMHRIKSRIDSRAILADMHNFKPLRSGSKEESVHRIASRIDSRAVLADMHNFKGMFNCAFLCLALCACTIEVPGKIPAQCLQMLERDLESSLSFKHLLEAVGSYIEERMMRSMALALIVRIGASNTLAWEKRSICRQLYRSYSHCAQGLWKVRVYAPVPAMKSHADELVTTSNDNLVDALLHMHLEAVVQLKYTLLFKPDWIEVQVGVDNVRCEVVPLPCKCCLECRGLSEEKYFPSRISVRVAPRLDSNIMSVSLNLSSNNPSYEHSNGASIQSGFELPAKFAMTAAATQASTTILKSWKMEQSVRGTDGNFGWVLYDGQSGKEMTKIRPSMKMWHPKAWFNHRDSSAFRPFTKQGGVVFAGNEYPEPISWRVKREMEEQTLGWEIGGSIWLTYWPNKCKTFYCETRQLDFCEAVELSLREDSTVR